MCAASWAISPLIPRNACSRQAQPQTKSAGPRERQQETGSSREPARAHACASSVTLEEYSPKSSLVVPEHLKTYANYRFIGVHDRQGFEQSDIQ